MPALRRDGERDGASGDVGDEGRPHPLAPLQRPGKAEDRARSGKRLEMPVGGERQAEDGTAGRIDEGQDALPAGAGERRPERDRDGEGAGRHRIGDDGAGALPHHLRRARMLAVEEAVDLDLPEARAAGALVAVDQADEAGGVARLGRVDVEGDLLAGPDGPAVGVAGEPHGKPSVAPHQGPRRDQDDDEADRHDDGTERVDQRDL